MKELNMKFIKKKGLRCVRAAYQVKLDGFEGPLDLLLHLIKQYEIDIYDIPVAEITEQYLTYIHTFKVLELDIASEYLVMASTLVAIKSQMLLPKQEMDAEIEEYEEDPHEELMNRLIEYRKYKEAAEKLKAREEEASHTYTRPPMALDDFASDKPTVVQGDVTIYDMLGALGKMLERKKWKEPFDTKVERNEVSIEERMTDVMNTVRQAGRGVRFDELFPVRSRTHIVVTFLALLELMKDQLVYCKQVKHFDTLYLYTMEE